MRQLAGCLANLWKNSAKTLCWEIQDGKTVLKLNTDLVTRLRNVLKSLQKIKMDINQESLSSKLAPPESVKGMVQLNRDAFTKTVNIPAIKIPKNDIGKTQKVLKPLFLKLRRLKPVVEINDSNSEKSQCLILLDPDKLQDDSLSEDKKIQLQNLGLNLDNPETFTVKLGYDNWSLSDIMRAILPSDQDSVSTFTQIGHIAHLNLKEETLPYKHLIGEVIIDKISTVKTVVNKLGAIDNTFRVFQMDLLAGEENYITQIKEHGFTFELDFSKVYWNSRLGSEHARMTDLIEKRSIVYDVFAGIGPFAVPLAKKRLCTVFANDLNPASFEYLKRNIDLNKLVNRTVRAYNMDGREFIKSVVKNNIIDRIKSASAEVNKALLPGADAVGSEPLESDIPAEKEAIPHSYVIMNLPALAIEFLDSFTSLLQDMPADLNQPEVLEPLLPRVFCYAFSHKNYLAENFQARVEMILGQPLPDPLDVRLVRNVAPNKEMVCLSFKLWPDLVLGSSEEKKGDVHIQEPALVLGSSEEKKGDVHIQEPALVLGSSEEKKGDVHIQEDVVEADICGEPESKKLKL